MVRNKVTTGYKFVSIFLLIWKINFAFETCSGHWILYCHYASASLDSGADCDFLLFQRQGKKKEEKRSVLGLCILLICWVLTGEQILYKCFEKCSIPHYHLILFLYWIICVWKYYICHLNCILLICILKWLHLNLMTK